MSVAPSKSDIQYPESGGRPLTESDVHIDWIFRVRHILRYRYTGQSVYVGSNMRVYYEEGKPYRFFVPDEFVVLGCDQRDRRTFKTWEEGRVPNVIFEITSSTSRQEDQIFKPKVYKRIGVAEYFVYDPLAEYLEPALQGFRLADGAYAKIDPGAEGWLTCEQLGIESRLDAGKLVMRDATTQQVLMTRAEAEQAAWRQELAMGQGEPSARRGKQAVRAAEAKLVELRSEVQRLRDALKKRAS